MQFSCVGQLQDAQDIVAVYKRLTERWKKVESHQKDIKMCILSGVKLQEKEVSRRFGLSLSTLGSCSCWLVRQSIEQKGLLGWLVVVVVVWYGGASACV